MENLIFISFQLLDYPLPREIRIVYFSNFFKDFPLFSPHPHKSLFGTFWQTFHHFHTVVTFFIRQLCHFAFNGFRQGTNFVDFHYQNILPISSFNHYFINIHFCLKNAKIFVLYFNCRLPRSKEWFSIRSGLKDTGCWKCIKNFNWITENFAFSHQNFYLHWWFNLDEKFSDYVSWN